MEDLKTILIGVLIQIVVSILGFTLGILAVILFCKAIGAESLIDILREASSLRQ